MDFESGFLGIALGLAVVLLVGWLLFRKMHVDWFGSHLRDLPVGRLRYLLAARFLRVAAAGFMMDIFLGGNLSRPLVLLFAFLFGLCGPVVLLQRHRPPFQRFLFIIPVVSILCAIAILHGRSSNLLSPSAAAAYRFDAICIFATLLASALVTTKHINAEGARQLRAETELEAARAVQQVLIPDEIPAISGFAIHAVYKPAGEVGGDFFQVIATQDGGVLAVIGDVSGKGMPAAMTVSLLVGTVRTLAHYTLSPGEVLRAMNQRMLTRTQGGFTTCLVLRMDSDGSFTAANAGHISPYLDGRELALENGLPLGLSADAAYPESQFHLNGRSQLTLMTDGVVEARNRRGELFGFERTAGLAVQPAESIAQTAQDFGQEDDITVVTLVSA